jgi:predicted DNA-binding antitoxin AbrB/MazE fold protein
LTETFTAVYEKGELRPLRPLDLEEGQIVRLLILPETVVGETPAPPPERISIEKDTTEPDSDDWAAYEEASKRALERLEKIKPRRPKN